MLNEKLLKENLITAYYISDDRKQIEILTQTDDGKAISPTIIESDPNHPYYKLLTKYVSEEELLEITHQRKKNELKAYKKMVLKLAKKDGLVYDVNEITKNLEKSPEKLSTLIKFFFDFIFGNTFDKDKHKDILFGLKLELFEKEQIKSCDNRELKSLMRKATTPEEVIKIAVQMLDHENKKQETPQKA